jgi:hypothetical protein
MNKANLKSYAPQARKDFIAAVTARANLLGLSEKAGSIEVAPAQTQGDVTLIGGQAWPAKVSGQRDKLIKRIRQDGFAPTMEAVAYTWFNRFAALRYMELHDYLGHGHRALSSTSGGLPDILTHATDLSRDLPGLNAAKVTELKLAGNRDGELYRMLLVAQCNALSSAMPFLFERIDDETELLLPDNLLRTDSIVARLVAGVPEEDWAEVEIIGWLYQFYISEKKDQVIGKVVKSEDIPAATQLFTPNWIVQYLVQNSVGRLWLMANPHSTLAQDWPYYITPAEQTPEVQAQLDALIQTRIREDGDTLNPESITVLDPACGSGHILVVAYDVLKAIYLERGYQPRAIPRLILEKNLFGLDIDDRAAQMAGFALLMKARADDRRLFTATDEAGNLQSPKLNVLSLQESKGLSVDELAPHLAPFKVQRATITALVETFEHAKTFGSLIQIPYSLKTHLAVLPEVLALVKQSGELYASAAADDLLPLVQQAQVLAMQFDAVVANPPYMGAKAFCQQLKDYLTENFNEAKSDLYSCFIVRNRNFIRNSGYAGMITIPSWMFLISYIELRNTMLMDGFLSSFLYNGRGVWGSDFGSCSFIFSSAPIAKYKGSFRKLFSKQGEVNGVEEINKKFFETRTYIVDAESLSGVPECPIAFWLSDTLRLSFEKYNLLGSVCPPKHGMSTGNNAKYLRFWWEVSFQKVSHSTSTLSECMASEKKWFPYNKGGEFRKWYGNRELTINYYKAGNEIKAAYRDGRNTGLRLVNEGDFFKPCITWADVTAGDSSFRYCPAGSIFDGRGSSCFPPESNLFTVLALLNSNSSKTILSGLNPGFTTTIGDLSRLPVVDAGVSVAGLAKEATEISESNYNGHERSWDFGYLQFVVRENRANLKNVWANWNSYTFSQHDRLKVIEEEINYLFISAFGLQDELSPEVPESQITVARADREKDCQRLISYAIGCTMGRYSLDEPGLIYAHAGNVGFEPVRYATFPADADGVVPITDELWFEDDAPSRIREFLRAVWGPDTLEENMSWLAESLGTKASETPDETIRRYIADKFFKDHLQTYKKRPIYWLFSSGKQGAFQALVYLHRYHEGTLARLRAEYVVPITGKIQSRIEMLQKDAAATNSTAARNKLAKEVEKLKKKHAELLAYDEQLRHYADMRITLDLDDGVKVNYGKFGELLAEVKAVTGGASDD